MSDTTKLPETVLPGRKVDPALDELATIISTDYAAIIKADREVMAANHSVVERAISLGNKLHMAKDKAGRGNWLPWLKEKCPEIPERTAQRYMNLADKADVLAKKMKSATMADLTLKMALDLVDDKTLSGDKKGGNASDTYDAVEKKLIEKLKKLEPTGAEAAVKETISKLQSTLRDIKQIADNVVKKAA